MHHSLKWLQRQELGWSESSRFFCISFLGGGAKVLKSASATFLDTLAERSKEEVRAWTSTHKESSGVSSGSGVIHFAIAIAPTSSLQWQFPLQCKSFLAWSHCFCFNCWCFWDPFQEVSAYGCVLQFHWCFPLVIWWCQVIDLDPWFYFELQS